MVTIPRDVHATPSDRWRAPGGGPADAGGGENDDNSGSAHQGQQGGRLGDACCRLLAALVLTTAMHPGTLMADLGTGPLPDGPTVRLRFGSFLLAVITSACKHSRGCYIQLVVVLGGGGSRLFSANVWFCVFILFDSEDENTGCLQTECALVSVSVDEASKKWCLVPSEGVRDGCFVCFLCFFFF